MGRVVGDWEAFHKEISLREEAEVEDGPRRKDTWRKVVKYAERRYVNGEGHIILGGVKIKDWEGKELVMRFIVGVLSDWLTT